MSVSLYGNTSDRPSLLNKDQLVYFGCGSVIDLHFRLPSCRLLVSLPIKVLIDRMAASQSLSISARSPAAFQPGSMKAGGQRQSNSTSGRSLARPPRSLVV